MKMKKGQIRVALVILAVIAIVALTGLILLFNEPGLNPRNIGNIYRGGIVETTKLPRYVPGGPEPEFPAGEEKTIGSRTPIMIFFKGEFRNIREMSICWNDLTFKIPAPEDAFSCYAVPTTGPAEEVTGWFWPDSSAKPRPFYQIGGDIYCYERTPHNRVELMNRIAEIGKEKGWTIGKMNNEDVLLCQKGQKFIYPQ